MRPLLKDRGHITHSFRMVPVNRMKQKCFQITTKQVRRSHRFQLRRYSLFHARGAATEKALSPITGPQWRIQGGRGGHGAMPPIIRDFFSKVRFLATVLA